MIRKVETDKAPAAGASPHSQAIVANGFVFTQGSIYLTTEGKLLEGRTEEQVQQIMKNLQAILEKAGASFKDVVKTTIFMTDMSLYGEINKVYSSYVSDPYPAREAVCVKELPLGAKVEISMIAAIPDSNP
ncbi:MAG TPA: Rid family detoxifying hydrolase [Patescibacteria group bacterium]|nr:Rid family detoxifying hydrolase [Patescibacteria group bacterium]